MSCNFKTAGAKLSADEWGVEKVGILRASEKQNVCM